MGIFKAINENVRNWLDQRQRWMRHVVDPGEIDDYYNWQSRSQYAILFSNLDTPPNPSDAQVAYSGKNFVLTLGSVAQTTGSFWNGYYHTGDNEYTSDGISPDHPAYLRPKPFIQSITISRTADYNLARTATIKIMCFSLQDLDKIEVLFMTCGASMTLQWGWALNQSLQQVVSYKDRKKLFNFSNIMEKVNRSSGTYDAMVGAVTTFSWSDNGNNVYDCSVTIVGMGYSLLSAPLASTLPVACKAPYVDSDGNIQVKSFSSIQGWFAKEFIKWARAVSANPQQNAGMGHSLAGQVIALSRYFTSADECTYITLNLFAELINKVGLWGNTLDFSAATTDKISKNIRSNRPDLFIIPGYPQAIHSKFRNATFDARNANNSDMVAANFDGNFGNILVNCSVLQSAVVNSSTVYNILQEILSVINNNIFGYWKLRAISTANETWTLRDVSIAENIIPQHHSFVFMNSCIGSILRECQISTTAESADLVNMMMWENAHGGGSSTSIFYTYGLTDGFLSDKDIDDASIPQDRQILLTDQEAAQKNTAPKTTAKVFYSDADGQYENIDEYLQSASSKRPAFLVTIPTALIESYRTDKLNLAQQKVSDYDAIKLLGLEASIGLDGTSGLYYCNTFSMNNLPQRYTRYIQGVGKMTFYIATVEDVIDDNGWSTSISAKMCIQESAE